MPRSIHRFIALALWAGAALGALAEPPMNPPSPTQAATEGLAVIVHRSNPMENLTFAELRKLCLAQRRQWDHGRKVTIVLREAEYLERAVVLEKVYGMQEDEFERFFLQEKFIGNVQVSPKQLSTAGGVRRFVFNVPGALGFVRASDVDDTVKVIRLDGKSASDSTYPLQIPIK